MNKEIKEIMELIKNNYKDYYINDFLTDEDVKILVDEIERLNNIIDKAIEYIHNHQLVFELSSKEEIQKWFDDFYKDSLNILEGEENESN